MSINKKHIILSMLILLSVYQLSAKIPADSLEVAQLKSQVIILQDSMDFYKNKLNTHFNDVSLIEETAKTISDPWELFKKLGLAGMLVLLSFGFIGLAINQLMPDWKLRLFRKLVPQTEEGGQLKERKNILVLLPEECTNRGFIDTFFIKSKLKYKTETIAEYKAPAGSYDIFFANNEKGGLEQRVLEEYLDKHKNIYLFYFGLRWEHKSRPDLSHRVNFANSRAQIYGNLMSTMKYHDLTVPEISA